jgi:hypothetical protein
LPTRIRVSGSFYIIASFQALLLEDLQVWTLEKYDDNTAIVKATDGNEKQIVRQIIPYTDFEDVKAIM